MHRATPLLPGESRREFETLRQMIIDDIRPRKPLSGSGSQTSPKCRGKSFVIVASNKRSLRHIGKLLSKRSCSDWTALKYPQVVPKYRNPAKPRGDLGGPREAAAVADCTA